MSNEQKQQQFGIQRIYIKDSSFESPNVPEIFTGDKWAPEVNVQINSNNNKVADDAYEVELKITITAKQSKKTAFLAEVVQAGVFQVTGFADQELGGVLGAYCPETLFPFAREAIAEMVNKGGFPQLLLAPVNFAELYKQHLQQQQANTASEDTAH